MTEPDDQHPHPDPTPAATPGAPVDDRRADPPPPASTTAGGDADVTEAQREAEATVHSISRLEESN